MPIDFPSSPTVGQQYIYNGVTYVYSSQGVWAPATGDPVLAARLDAYDAMCITSLDTRHIQNGSWFAFSENNLRVNKIAGGTNYTPIFSNAAAAELDYLYFEVTIMQWTVGQILGVANRGHGNGNDYYPGSDTYSVGFHGNGTYYYNGGASGASYPTYAQGHTIAFAVAVSYSSIWMRNVTTNTFWNNSSSYDPAGTPPSGGIGSVPFYYNMGPLKACLALYGVNDSVRANFDGPFLGTAPAGYRRWRGKAIP